MSTTAKTRHGMAAFPHTVNIASKETDGYSATFIYAPGAGHKPHVILSDVPLLPGLQFTFNILRDGGRLCVQSSFYIGLHELPIITPFLHACEAKLLIELNIRKVLLECLAD